MRTIDQRKERATTGGHMTRLSLGEVEDLMLHGERKDIYRTLQGHKPQQRQRNQSRTNAHKNGSSTAAAHNEVVVKIPQAGPDDT